MQIVCHEFYNNQTTSQINSSGSSHWDSWKLLKVWWDGCLWSNTLDTSCWFSFDQSLYFNSMPSMLSRVMLLLWMHFFATPTWLIAYIVNITHCWWKNFIWWCYYSLLRFGFSAFYCVERFESSCIYVYGLRQTAWANHQRNYLNSWPSDRHSTSSTTVHPNRWARDIFRNPHLDFLVHDFWLWAGCRGEVFAPRTCLFFPYLQSLQFNLPRGPVGPVLPYLVFPGLAEWNSRFSTEDWV